VLVSPERTPQRVWTNELEQNGYTDGLQTIPVVDYSTTLSATTSAPVDSMRYLTSSSTSNGRASGDAATRGITTTTGTIQMYNTYPHEVRCFAMYQLDSLVCICTLMHGGFTS
jgi:hypothetical protein